jgi:tRNA uridine 5-carboxymethylaminomethyl modification enzyme
MQPEIINTSLDAIGTAPIKEKMAVFQLLKRPEINLKALSAADHDLQSLLSNYSREEMAQVEIQAIYQTYIDKEQRLVEKMEQLEDYTIKSDFNYSDIKALSAEAIEKLNKIRPKTIGQASRISGVSPADISVVLVYLGK